MQINGSIPIHVARAYGVKPPTAPVAAPPAAQPAAPAAPAPAPFALPTSPPATTESISALVGGHVSRPIDFNAEPDTARPSHAFQLYTRAADKIEAAVGVQIGRSIDVTG